MQFMMFQVVVNSGYDHWKKLIWCSVQGGSQCRWKNHKGGNPGGKDRLTQLLYNNIIINYQQAYQTKTYTIIYTHATNNDQLPPNEAIPDWCLHK